MAFGANMTATKCQVVSVSRKQIAVSPLTGPLRNKIYGLPLRSNVAEGAFVEILINPSGTRVEWPHN